MKHPLAASVSGAQWSYSSPPPGLSTCVRPPAPHGARSGRSFAGLELGYNSNHEVGLVETEGRFVRGNARGVGRWLVVLARAVSLASVGGMAGLALGHGILTGPDPADYAVRAQRT